MHQSIANKLRLTTAFSLTVLATLGSSNSVADEARYKWSQEVGYYLINPDADSSELSGPGLPPGTAAEVDNGGSYLLTTTYHHSNNLSFEFVYSGWNELDVSAAGSIAGLGKIGSIEYLAPTLVANWTFGDDSWVARPYLGIGINRMIYDHESANDTLNAALGGPTDISVDDTWGAVFTAGLTANISERICVTAAYVLITSDTTATLTTDTVGTKRKVDLDADLNIGYLTIGYRF